MEVEMPDDLAEKIADWIGIYGGCKSDGDTGCTLDENKPFCCRVGFVSTITDRIRQAAENECNPNTGIMYEAEDGKRFSNRIRYGDHQFKLHLKKLEAINKKSWIQAGLPWIILGMFVAGYILGALM